MPIERILKVLPLPKILR